MGLLKAENIYYIGDLVQRTETELRERRFSSTAIVEIRVALWNRGLDLTKDKGPLRMKWLDSVLLPAIEPTAKQQAPVGEYATIVGGLREK